jgi:hypothetical protein
MSRFVTTDHEHGFWVENSLHDLWWMLLALHIDTRLEWYAIESRIQHQWMYASKYNVTGCEYDELSTFLGEPGGFEVISAALERLSDAISRLPEDLTEQFALMGFGYEIGPSKRRVLVAMAAAFRDLLHNKITTKVGDKVDVLGLYGAWDDRH